MFKAKGRLIYDPKPLRANFKARKEATWCAKLTVPSSIMDYYQYWIRKELGINVNTPVWDAHVTVARYDEPRNKGVWGKYEGEIIDFEYSPEFKSSDLYFWLTVKCPRIEEIRRELGLAPTPRCPWHITVGNTKNINPPRRKQLPFVIFPWEAEKYVDFDVKPYRIHK